ncbi:hypothetical protein BASA81_010128 [Batrachochytrium salamandrivorans]|nr:hypothetical protein BASA81_010128 [Batrachochytrium salamandrivorans]
MAAEEQLKRALAQLAQVQGLLEEEPSNPELLQLANDLREAVCVAEALVGKQDLGPSLNQWTSTSSSSSSVKPMRLATPAASALQRLEFLPNAHVEVRQSAASKLWQGGVVLQRLPDYTYVVVRLCDGKELTLKGDGASLRECLEPPQLVLDRVTVGMRVRARYSADGKYYQAQVSKTSPHGLWVKFDGYEDDEPEHVLVEHCRESEPGEAPSLLQMDLDVPKHLVVLDTDSEDVRLKKLRQSKAWRRKTRDEQIDQVHSVKQENWLSFQASTSSTTASSSSLHKRTRY